MRAAETAHNTIAEDDVDGDDAIVEEAGNRYDHAVRPTHHARELPTERRLIMSLNGEDQQEEEAADRGGAPPRFVPRDLLREDAGVRCLAYCPTSDLLGFDGAG